MSIKAGAIVIFVLFWLILNECQDKELHCCPAYFPWPSPGAAAGAAAELGMFGKSQTEPRFHPKDGGRVLGWGGHGRRWGMAGMT